jgi:thiamine-phosphate pyrophosphorylase
VGRELVELLHSAIAGGVDVVQLREKHLGDEELIAVAHAAHALCERLGALLIVNDRPTVAVEAGADGVHVGQDDMPLAEVRELVGEELIIGLSTHAPAEIDATGEHATGGQADTSGASTGRPASARPDYIGVGPVHETPTKPGRPAVGLELVRYAAAHAEVPFFAIGGIDLTNIGEVSNAGARRIAVLRAITDAQDPEDAAKQLRDALDIGGASIGSKAGEGIGGD